MYNAIIMRLKEIQEDRCISQESSRETWHTEGAKHGEKPKDQRGIKRA